MLEGSRRLSSSKRWPCSTKDRLSVSKISMRVCLFFRARFLKCTMSAAWLYNEASIVGVQRRTRVLLNWMSAAIAVTQSGKPRMYCRTLGSLTSKRLVWVGSLCKFAAVLAWAGLASAKQREPLRTSKPNWSALCAEKVGSLRYNQSVW